jgi:hypothetical protein
VAARFAKGKGDSAKHAAGAYRTAEDVDFSAALLQEFAANAHVALQSVLVVELIGPVGVVLGGQDGNFFLEAVEQGGRDLPVSLATMWSSAPKASMVNSFSLAKASEDRTTKG